MKKDSKVRREEKEIKKEIQLFWGDIHRGYLFSLPLVLKSKYLVLPLAYSLLPVDSENGVLFNATILHITITTCRACPNLVKAVGFREFRGLVPKFKLRGSAVRKGSCVWC